MKIFLEKWGVVRDGSPYRGRGRLYKKGKLCFSLVIMASVAVMLFNQQVFHLECLLMLLLFRIKSQSVIAYKSVVYK